MRWLWQRGLGRPWDVNKQCQKTTPVSIDRAAASRYRYASLFNLIGLIELHPGDFVFARDKNSTGNPADDILLAFVNAK